MRKPTTVLSLLRLGVAVCLINGFSRFSQVVKVAELMGDAWQSRGDRIANRKLSIGNHPMNRNREYIDAPLSETLTSHGARRPYRPAQAALTPPAKQVIELAVEEARRLNHPFIGTEHLLLALARERTGVAASVLSNLGVELNKIRDAVAFSIHHQDHIIPAGLTEREAEILRLMELKLTADQVAEKLLIDSSTLLKHLTSIYGKRESISRSAAVRSVIELAVDEARLLNHHYVGIEHLLLGLLREEKGIAAAVLESLGLTLEQVRMETVKMLHEPNSS